MSNESAKKERKMHIKRLNNSDHKCTPYVRSTYTVNNKTIQNNQATFISFPGVQERKTKLIERERKGAEEL